LDLTSWAELPDGTRVLRGGGFVWRDDEGGGYVAFAAGQILGRFECVSDAMAAVQKRMAQSS